MTNTRDINPALRAGVEQCRLETGQISAQIAGMDAVRTNRRELEMHIAVEMLIVTVGLVDADGRHSTNERELLALVTEGAALPSTGFLDDAPTWRRGPGADVLVGGLKDLFPSLLVAPSKVMVALADIDRVVGTQFANRYRDAVWRYAVLVASCDGPMTIEASDSVTRLVGAMNSAIPQLSQPGAQASSVAAQWAPDPYSRYELRYWDGWRWTEHVSTQGAVYRDHALR